MNSGQDYRKLEDWLDDLCVRFIINLPADDLSSMERVCFQVEEAQWFYEDFIRPSDPTLPTLPLRSFCALIFKHCPIFADYPVEAHERAFENFLQYKQRIPVRGAIMLNDAMDHVVLVKGWKKTASWSFPRGKINKDEDDLDCAIREVEEETGLDLREAGLVPAEEPKHIDINIREQALRLYVFRNVPMDTPFEPKTRKEISKIEWFPLSDLPTFRKKNQYFDDVSGSTANNKFYMVAPFLGHLKKWVQKQKRMDMRRQGTTDVSHLSPGGIPEECYDEEPQHNSANQYDPQQQAELRDASIDLQRMLKVEGSYGSDGGIPSYAPTPPQNLDSKSADLLAVLRGTGSSNGNHDHNSQDDYNYRTDSAQAKIEPVEPLTNQTPPAQIHHPQPIPPQVQKANLDQGLLSYATPPPNNMKHQGQPLSLQSIMAQSRIQQQQQQQQQKQQQQKQQEEFQRRAQEQAQQQPHQGFADQSSQQMGGHSYQQHQQPYGDHGQSQSQPQPQPAQMYGQNQYGPRPGSEQYGQGQANPDQHLHRQSGAALSNHSKNLLGMLTGSPSTTAAQPIPIPTQNLLQPTESQSGRSWSNETPEQYLARIQQATNSNGGASSQYSQGGESYPRMDPMAVHNGQAILNGMMQKQQQQGSQSEKQRSTLLDMFKGGAASPAANEPQQPGSHPGSYRQSPMDNQSYSGSRHGGDTASLHNAMGNLTLHGGVRQSSSMSSPNYVRGSVSVDSPVPILQRDSISPSIGGHSRHSQTPYNFDRTNLESTAPSQSAIASPPVSNAMPVAGAGAGKRSEASSDQKQKLLSLFGAQNQQAQAPTQSHAQQPVSVSMGGYYSQAQIPLQGSPQQQYMQPYGHPGMQSQVQYYSSSYQQSQPHPLSRSQLPGVDTTYVERSQSGDAIGTVSGYQQQPQPQQQQQQPLHQQQYNRNSYHQQQQQQQQQQYPMQGQQQPVYGGMATDAYKRMPSATSGISEASHPSTGGNKTPISPADRNFLLGYLQSAMTQPTGR